MGLDMWLTKKVFIGANYDHRNVKGEINITINGEPVNINMSKVSYVILEQGCWRKANHIHKWFVENVQDGVDDCKAYEVSAGQLQELLDLCYEVKNDHSKAAELLPTQEGFFFGDSDYDEYYFENIDYTIEVLTDAISNEGYLIEFEYQSSW